MPFPIDQFPHSDFHSLDVRYWLNQFEQMTNDWHDLYADMITWKNGTIADLENWKNTETARLNTWQDEIETNINTFESTLTAEQTLWFSEKTAELNAWKTSFETLFNTTFSNLTEIKTAAENARDEAVASAESIEESAAQIETNRTDIAKLFENDTIAGIFTASTWAHGRISVSGNTAGGNVTSGDAIKSIFSGLIPVNNTKTLRIIAPIIPDGCDGLSVYVVEYSENSIAHSSFVTSSNLYTVTEGISKTVSLNSNTNYIRLCIRSRLGTSYDVVELPLDFCYKVIVIFEDSAISQAWKYGIDKTLSISGYAADAYETGEKFSKCFVSKSLLEYNTDLNTVFTDGYYFLSGSSSANYINSPLASQKAGTLEVLKVTSQITLQRISSFDGENVWIRTSNSGSFANRNWNLISVHKPTIKIAYFGDSITRGTTNPTNTTTSWTANNIPNGVANELNCTCENFGIGSIGYCNDDNGDKDIAYEYIKRWCDADEISNWYANDWTDDTKFLGRGYIGDFDTVILAYGANDNANYQVGTLADVSPYDDNNYDYNPENITDLTIVKQLYRCVRYIKDVKPEINIILVCPFVAGTFVPTGDYTYQHTVDGITHTKNDIINLYIDFAKKYGCGCIITYDAPINRFNIAGALTGIGNKHVHPTETVYKALGKYMSGKISALTY